MLDQNTILNSMRHIIDPDLGRDIVSLGFIKNLKIDGGDVSFTVELTTHACPVKDTFKLRCEEAVRALPGVTSVNVTMGAMERKERPGSGVNTLESVNAVIAVSSCKGGVGKSTVAAHLALAMVREGLKVGLLDADVYGPSLPTLFGIHQPQVAMLNNKIQPLIVNGLKVMSLGFLLGDQPAVLRGPIVSGYITQILRQTDWGDLDYLVIDMPPGTGDIQLTIVQQASLDGAIIVTTPQALSLVDVARGILMFEKVAVPVLGVVENMTSFQCRDCGNVHYPFGRGKSTLQERFGLATLAELPIVPGVSDLAKPDAGSELEELAKLAENVHRAIGKSRIEAESHPEVSYADGYIHIKWPDGEEDDIPPYNLRCACPCAACIDEYTGAPILDPNAVPRDIQPQTMQPLGNYAVSIAWTDGHSSGIFAWEFLREFAKRVARANA